MDKNADGRRDPAWLLILFAVAGVSAFAYWSMSHDGPVLVEEREQATGSERSEQVDPSALPRLRDDPLADVVELLTEDRRTFRDQADPFPDLHDAALGHALAAEEEAAAAAEYHDDEVQDQLDAAADLEEQMNADELRSAGEPSVGSEPQPTPEEMTRLLRLEEEATDAALMSRERDDYQEFLEANGLEDSAASERQYLRLREFE